MFKPMNIQKFFELFPNDDACLEHLFKIRYGTEPRCTKCGQVGKFRKLSKMPAYTCNCGHHIHPMVGTPFERSRTPLQKWFYAMFIFTTTRNGVAAKEIQRQLGVTYKTAWRIAHEIRKYMNQVDGDGPIGPKGIVEADKAFIGGKDKQGQDDKSVVLGVVERGGDLVTRVIPNRREYTVANAVTSLVQRGARIATDEARAFKNLPEYGYRHGTVNHSKKEWTAGPNNEVHTNTIEAFWGWLKRGVNGTHVWVSEKHLPKYLGEFEFRFNLRDRPDQMFPLLLVSFPKP
ncbi:IS1595 family transposase [Salaquimonas pukyongi]|uniref:IS1595 family transposase n=1 Tax=Salaquimonas pukyongi TaxID=2712698 RepID=UPI00096BAD74|nr:IS1595 family transposase [Salaquimonas pukyongi]